MADERGEQPELERGQLDVVAPDRDAALGEVDAEEVVRVRVLRGPARAAPAEHRLDAREELLPAERLRDVVVRARLQPADLLQLGGAGRQHRHGHVGHVTDALERLPAVQLGHGDVEEHDVGRRRVQRPQPVAPVGRLGDLVALTLEQLPQEAADVGVVVDDEHVTPVHAPCLPDPAGIRPHDPGEAARLQNDHELLREAARGRPSVSPPLLGEAATPPTILRLGGRPHKQEASTARRGTSRAPRASAGRGSRPTPGA